MTVRDSVNNVGIVGGWCSFDDEPVRLKKVFPFWSQALPLMMTEGILASTWFLSGRPHPD